MGSEPGFRSLSGRVFLTIPLSGPGQAFAQMRFGRAAVPWNRPYAKPRQQYCVHRRDTFCLRGENYFGALHLSQIDPTDHALATIASILDSPEPIPATAMAAPEEQPAISPLTEAAGYSKIGPGPMAAIRFKWTVRRGDDASYYVDETVGDASLPIVMGPMSAAAAIRLVDERERETLLRFERLRTEMAARSVDGNPSHWNREE